jgi:fructose-1,6-bisphosphatase/inositol monophosphatase family enzyme
MCHWDIRARRTSARGWFCDTVVRMDLSYTELCQLSRFAVDVVNAGGEMMREGLYSRHLDIKGDGTEVTDVDVAINEYVLEHIATRTPEYGVVGEEASRAGSVPCTWVLDPIDGTLPYSAGIGVSVVALSLVVEGTTVLAAVRDPWTGVTYSGVAGGRSMRNGRDIHVSGAQGISGARVGVSTAGLYVPLGRAGARVLSVGSSVRLGASVADGRLDALVFGPGEPWDISSTLLLVAQAGGVILSLDTGKTGSDATRGCGRIIAAGTAQLGEALATFWAGV